MKLQSKKKFKIAKLKSSDIFYDLETIQLCLAIKTIHFSIDNNSIRLFSFKENRLPSWQN